MIHVQNVPLLWLINSCFLLLSLLLFPGCEYQDSPADLSRLKKATSDSSGTLHIEIRSLDNKMKFNKDTLHVPAGKQCTITLINEATFDAMKHNLVIVPKGKTEEIAMLGLKAGMDNDYIPYGDHDVLAHTPMADPGETVQLTYTFTRAGTYEFVCTYPGHYQMMRGTIVVQK